MRKDVKAAIQPVLSLSICADITVVSAHWVWRLARCYSSILVSVMASSLPRSSARTWSAVAVQALRPVAERIIAL